MTLKNIEYTASNNEYYISCEMVTLCVCNLKADFPRTSKCLHCCSDSRNCVLSKTSFTFVWCSFHNMKPSLPNQTVVRKLFERNVSNIVREHRILPSGSTCVGKKVQSATHTVAHFWLVYNAKQTAPSQSQWNYLSNEYKCFKLC